MTPSNVENYPEAPPPCSYLLRTAALQPLLRP
jgi:hypothetical protein